jgi:acyl-CoA reductase-like NAD-dependent aldehyde dehydrogenase
MQKMLIGGHLVGAEEWLPVLNPYTGEPVDHVARGGAVHVDQAVALARHGAEKMREMSLSQRAAILRHVAELIRQERGALATLLTQETGKLIGESRIEVERAAMVFELAAEACHHPRATQFPPESFTDGASRFGSGRASRWASWSQSWRSTYRWRTRRKKLHLPSPRATPSSSSPPPKPR